MGKRKWKEMKRKTRKLIDIFFPFQHKFWSCSPHSWNSEFSCCYVPHSQAYLIPFGRNLYILEWKKKSRQLVIRLKTIERNQRFIIVLWSKFEFGIENFFSMWLDIVLAVISGLHRLLGKIWHKNLL